MIRTIPKLARTFSTASIRQVRREVIVSQSEDQLSNVALEDWMMRKTDLSQKSLLILSKSITRASNLEIKATLLDENSFWKVGELEDLALSSLSPSLPLTRLPDVTRMREMVDRSSSSVSLQLEVSGEVSRQDVLDTLDSLGWRFLAGRGQLSLVRPDEDWFPGLRQIKASLVQTLELVGERRGAGAGRQMETFNRQSSFGQ